ncbi:hypothetical protein A2881_02165 [Candidatus Peribacteria bacterium RIFCSPHIGHO2_01_FULL_55_13]|nr:MAG: hypothetical protein A2881_02165 [Candidatus Peribacteria bacterium RIFCSPHIGHO2_01_FULL_55_13]OGJ64364.1 MAG: hypothetical protein A3F36_01075 [Candidatus Peribacteria bacterium RIFCSPHIGHO2_12_FULL_55_11]
MSLLKKKASRLVLGSGVLLAALSVYAASVSTSSLSGAVSENGGTYRMAPRAVVRRARNDWRALRESIRTAVPAVREQRESTGGVDAITLRSAQLTMDHLDVAYALPEAECVSLWMTGAANQEFQRLNVIGGVPCSLNARELSAHLRLEGIQPAVTEGQLVQVCTNARQYCSQPIAVTSGGGTHGAAQEAITIHSATIARNAYLSVTYSKGEGCTEIVRWNGAGETQKVSYDDEPFTCDAVDHGTARVNIRGMQPLLGPTQWIYLCTDNDATHCSNAYRIR